MRAFFIYMPRGWWQQNLVVHHRTLDHLLATVYDLSQPRVFTAASEQTGAYVESALAAAHPFHIVAAAAIPNLGRALKRAAEIEIENHHALLVCALERHEFRHGSYPASLNELAPALISELPKDATSGEVPFYQRQADGTFMLVSRGWSCQSKGGPDQPGHPGADDYVWPFPKRP
jgi:hypothetical protein